MDGINIKESPDGGVNLYIGSAVFPLKHAGPGAVNALLRLAAGGATWEELDEIARTGDWFHSNFPKYIEKMSRLCCITWALMENGNRVAKLVATGQGFNLNLPEVIQEQRFKLSRFAYSRVLEQKTVIETPLLPIRLELDGWLGAALWGLLPTPSSLQEICSVFPEIDPRTIKLLLQLFCAAEIAQVAAGDSIGEDRHQALRQWEFHDLLFHSRVLIGRHNNPTGATFRFWPQIPPLPACKPPMQGEVIELYRPDLEQLKENDYPFTLILEERRSVRDYAPEAITLKQLGEFLYRSARVRRLQPADPERGIMYEYSSRPYPGGGSCHALEIYLTVGECRGLDPGLYHYNPLEHRLTKLSGANRFTNLILKEAENSASQMCNPQVVLNITARFARLTWKYSSIAYSLILKDVGVLYQTMYLVATAMELAPCALGCGHSDWLCRAAGLDYLEESLVGEFLLGSKRVSAMGVD